MHLPVCECQDGLVEVIILKEAFQQVLSWCCSNTRLEERLMLRISQILSVGFLAKSHGHSCRILSGQSIPYKSCFRQGKVSFPFTVCLSGSIELGCNLCFSNPPRLGQP
eukprot:6432199-Amphidinium_carterae.1